MEWDIRNGVIQRYGRRHGIAVPVSDVVVPLLAGRGERDSGINVWGIGLGENLASVPYKRTHRQTKTLRQRAYDPALTCLIYLGLKYLFNLRSVFRNCLLRRSAAEIVLLTRLYRNV